MRWHIISRLIKGTSVLRLSNLIEESIEDAIAGCRSVADISILSQRIVELHPELRFEIDSLTEVLVAKASTRGLAIRLK